MKALVRIIGVCFLFVMATTFLSAGSSHSSSMPKVLTLVTHGIGTGGYAMVSGIASVLSKHLPTEIKVMPTTGANEILPLIATGQAQLSGSNMWDVREGWLGGETFKDALRGRRAPVRLLTSGSPNRNSVLVGVDSGIKTGMDLKGKKFVGKFAGSASITMQARAALAHFGLTPNDVRMISVPGPGAGVKAIIEGRADATGSAVLGMGVIKELEAKRGAQFLSFDPSPEAVKRYTDIFPAKLIKVEPKKGIAGVRKPIYMMQYEWYLWCHANLINDETAYQIVKVMWDFNEELGAISARLRKWTRDRFVTTNPTIPYHPGAIKFYKEKGLWSSEMVALQQKLLSMEK